MTFEGKNEIKISPIIYCQNRFGEEKNISKRENYRERNTNECERNKKNIQVNKINKSENLKLMREKTQKIKRE